MSVLNITNGDGAGNLLRASSVVGDILPWRDPMHHGPFPAGLDLSELSVVRADYLSGPTEDPSAARHDFEARDAHLRVAGRYTEIVLWFEHDLLDQLQILQLLDWFLDVGFDRTKLTLVCIDRFDGVPDFRGLGNLTPAQVASLWDKRQPVTCDQLKLARAGWQAFRSPDPRDLQRFTTCDLAALPFLGPALRRHLEDYPWRSDGLTRTERQILKLIADGISAPGRIFVENMNLEDVLFMGDWSTFRHIDQLCQAKTPLLQCAPGPEFQYPPKMVIARDDFLAQRLTLSESGRSVLSGTAHASDMIERDMWLGGVHLRSDRPLWMWDDDNDQLELVP